MDWTAEAATSIVKEAEDQWNSLHEKQIGSEMRDDDELMKLSKLERPEVGEMLLDNGEGKNENRVTRRMRQRQKKKSHQPKTHGKEAKAQLDEKKKKPRRGRKAHKRKSVTQCVSELSVRFADAVTVCLYDSDSESDSERQRATRRESEQPIVCESDEDSMPMLTARKEAAMHCDADCNDTNSTCVNASRYVFSFLLYQSSATCIRF